MTYLDAGEAKEAGLLALEPLEDLVRVVAIDVGLGHERESHTVVELAELGDLLVILGLLSAELLPIMNRGRASCKYGITEDLRDPHERAEKVRTEWKDWDADRRDAPGCTGTRG